MQDQSLRMLNESAVCTAGAAPIWPATQRQDPLIATRYPILPTNAVMSDQVQSGSITTAISDGPLHLDHPSILSQRDYWIRTRGASRRHPSSGSRNYK